jgi:hypothetical protein
VAKLPPFNSFTLELVMWCLHQVALEDENMMPPEHIAIIFAPHLLRKKDSNPFSTSNTPTAYRLIIMMIHNYQMIFRVRASVFFNSIFDSSCMHSNYIYFIIGNC